VRFLCPGCQRSFDEAGFCPFDGTRLASPADPEARTLRSGSLAAAEPHATAVDPRRGTFPLTPSVPGPPTPSDLPKVHALSASENPEAALGSYRSGRANDYDKLVGQTLDGRYYVQKKIGEGGMGVVFSARHAVIERPLAIKVLKREVMRDTATIRRFVQEAKAASRIGHPNIVDVTDFGTTPDGMTYSVMEYVSGQTLGAAIRAGAPFAMPRASRIAAQIARALGAAHDKGIVHRDLKPENVFLVDRDGRPDFVKIVDFGIAKVTPTGGHNPNEPRLTRAGSVFGTPEYMAPEQAAGRSDTDGRVDIYALGVILYEMITGRVPHKGDSMVRTLAMQMLDPVEPPTKVRPDLDIGPDLEALILKALAKKREHRFQTMGELLSALDRLQTPVGLSVTGSPVYALTPLPPGADPDFAGVTAPMHAVLPSPLPSSPIPIPTPSSSGAGDLSGPIHVAAPITSPGDRARTPTGPAPGRRLKDEPEFVTRDKPITFEHVFTDELTVPRRRAWPIVLLFALILAGAAGAIAVVVQSRNRAVAALSRDAGLPPPADATFLAHDPDAGLPADAPAPPADAVLVVQAPADAAVRLPVRPRDAAVVASLPVTPNGRGTIGIQVLTRPEGATLYVGTEYRGPGGAQLEEPFGTRLEVICKHPGYKNGSVKLTFDGTREAELCILQRIVVCIPGVKNPFDQCPD
jgi:serine/threonine protein kinase